MNAVGTRARRYEIVEKGDGWAEFGSLLWTCVGGELLCVGSVCALLFKTKADHTGRQTFGGAECLSLSSR